MKNNFLQYTVLVAVLVFFALPVSAFAQFTDDPIGDSGFTDDTGSDSGWYGSFTDDPTNGGYGYSDYGYPQGSFTDDSVGSGMFTDDPTNTYAGSFTDDPTNNNYYDPYSGYGNSSYPYGSTYSPSPLNNDYCYNCISGRSSAYGVGGTQNYGGGYGNGWGMMYSNYGYAPVYGYGSTQYASVGYPMYQYPQHYQQPMYYTQPTQNNGYNYTLSWGNISMGPVLYSKSIGTSVPLYGTYPSCTIYFLPGDTDYMRGLKWSGINISQAMLSGYGQVTGEGYMQVPYNGSAYMLTVWNSKGEMTTCSTR